MDKSRYSGWWREMGAISRGMLFMDGSIATAKAMETIAGTDPTVSRRTTSRYVAAKVRCAPDSHDRSSTQTVG